MGLRKTWPRNCLLDQLLGLFEDSRWPPHRLVACASVHARSREAALLLYTCSLGYKSPAKFEIRVS